jgi:hypothetical protein
MIAATESYITHHTVSLCWAQVSRHSIDAFRDGIAMTVSEISPSAYRLLLRSSNLRLIGTLPSNPYASLNPTYDVSPMAAWVFGTHRRSWLDSYCGITSGGAPVFTGHFRYQICERCFGARREFPRLGSTPVSCRAVRDDSNVPGTGGQPSVRKLCVICVCGRWQSAGGRICLPLFGYSLQILQVSIRTKDRRVDTTV